MCLEEIKLNRTYHFQSLQFGSGVYTFEWNSFKIGLLNIAILMISLFLFSSGNTISV